VNQAPVEAGDTVLTPVVRSEVYCLRLNPESGTSLGACRFTRPRAGNPPPGMAPGSLLASPGGAILTEDHGRGEPE
jgi:hypothetical protein